MAIASSVQSPLLPSCFRRRCSASAYVPTTPEEAYDMLRRRRRRRSPEKEAYGTEKRRWIAEQKRLMAKAKRWPRNSPSNGAIVFDARRYGTMSLDEALAYEFDRKLFFEEAMWLSAVRGLLNNHGHGAPEPEPTAAVDSRLVTEEEIHPGRGTEDYYAKLLE